MTRAELVAALHAKDRIGDAAFVELVKEASAFLADQDLAPLFEVERGTLGRWSAGKNLPHPFIRGTLCELLARRLER